MSVDGTKIIGFVKEQSTICHSSINSGSSEVKAVVEGSASSLDLALEQPARLLATVASCDEIVAGGSHKDGRTKPDHDGSYMINAHSAYPKHDIMRGGREREEAEKAFDGLKDPAAGQPSRRSSTTALDSDKETSKLLQKELAVTMAKLQVTRGGPSANEMTRSNIILRSASSSPKGT